MAKKPGFFFKRSDKTWFLSLCHRSPHPQGLLQRHLSLVQRPPDNHATQSSLVRPPDVLQARHAAGSDDVQVALWACRGSLS
jgi:hypothetical protein